MVAGNYVRISGGQTMSDLLRFPTKRHHDARASENSTGTGRATSAIILSAVRPSSCATLVPRTADHHSSGMRSRCHHFDTAPAEAPAGAPPRSAAMPSRVGQSSMIDRNEVCSAIPSLLRQSVLDCKAIVSHDCEQPLRHNVPMAEGIPSSEFQANFIGRVKAAREARYGSQEEICEVLAMKQPTYGKYESRSLMPHSLIPRFLLACGVSYEWLFSGRGIGPAWQPVWPQQKKPRKPRKTSRKAA